MSEGGEGVTPNIILTEKPPIYGIGAPGKHEYTDTRRSGLPESYANLISGLVITETQKNGGIFLDVGGGTGELGKSIEETTGVKSLTLDRSPVGLKANEITNGVVAEATAFPLPDGVAGLVHAKDLIEHLDDKQLVELANETRRVLVPGGKLIITDKNYYTKFPFFQRSYTMIKSGDKEKNVQILPGENYEQATKRLKLKYGEDVIVGPPYFARSKNGIIEKLAESGFKQEQETIWKANKNEPDWFGSRTPRNILVFTPVDNSPKTDTRPGLLHHIKEVFNRFADPRDCKTLEDVVGRKVEDMTLKARRIDWAPRKLDIARMAEVIDLVREQQTDGKPLKIVDVAGHIGFLDRLILDKLDENSGVRSNVEMTIVDPYKEVVNKAKNYYRTRENRLNFETKKNTRLCKIG